MAYEKIYERINWKNKQEALSSALGATNMNKIDYTLDEIDKRVVELDRKKAEQEEVDSVKKSTSENSTSISLLKTESGHSLELIIDENYIMTISLLNKSGETISSKAIDFPIESMVVNASYSSGKLTLVLQNGNMVDVDVSSIVKGLVNESRTIAGIDLKDDITADELIVALGVDVIKNDVAQLKSDLSNIGYVSTSTALSPTKNEDGRYWAGNNAWGHNANYYVSTRFQLLKGQVLNYSAYGETGVYMLVECDGAYNEIQSGEHIAFGSNLTTPLIGKFTAPKDMWVSLSVNQTKTNSYSIVEIEYEVLDDIAELKSATEGLVETETPTYNVVTDKYINSNGLIAISSGFVYSAPIAVEAGDKILLNGGGYLTNVGMISTCDSDGNNIVVQVPSAYGVTSYSYDVVADGYIIVSYNNNVAHSLYIVKNAIAKYGAEIEQLKQTPYISLSLFERIGVVGDSYASGELYYNSQYIDKYPISWGQILARKLGVTCTNYSKGGLTTKTWLTSAKGLSLMNASPADNLYLLALGINDVLSGGSDYLGSITDITNHQSYEDYGDTFYGNYGRIIDQIQAHAPHAKIVMFTLASSTTLGSSYNNAIIEIAEHYGIPHIVQLDDSFFQSSLYTSMSGGHPRAVAYSGMAMAFERLLTKCILDKWSYFSDYYMY